MKVLIVGRPPVKKEDEQAGDDGTVSLTLDADGFVAVKVLAAEHVVEEATEEFELPATAVEVGEKFGGNIEEIRGDA